MRFCLHRCILPLLASLLLAGCGFSPIYAPQPAGESESYQDLASQFAMIEVAQPGDRLGQQVRNRLIGMLSPRGTPDVPRYGLRVDLDEKLEGFAFRQDRAITRQKLQLDAMITLVDLQTGDVAVADDLSAWMTYDVVQSDFANLSAQRDARERTANQIVDRIVARLARHFRQKDPS
ncbi:twin-arginine translocation pathway signal protein [Iodidimonas nitroreducens]|uniref:Twin-arginine translocation pathway signal protein n=1 Tax=Iodidimonas nitroreducens TaxID=1236968 RepID=A0A5A7N2A2_9PROT|nr:LPS assembly lipoprotein LptE [Iodidimonas nitroreducens]GAK34855.1 hypothetical protein AQ1_02763 [alpha proteobacterium Q-1]GER02411.1 twin-arginine translocation pathway signal protein [Iodidimonas nitroreducens]